MFAAIILGGKPASGSSSTLKTFVIDRINIFLDIRSKVLENMNGKEDVSHGSREDPGT